MMTIKILMINAGDGDDEQDDTELASQCASGLLSVLACTHLRTVSDVRWCGCCPNRTHHHHHHHP